MLIGMLAEELRALDLPVQEIDGGHWLKLDTERALLTIEPRPHYCDRGNFIVKVFPQGDRAVHVDGQDGFPRYYFGVTACALEVYEWMRVRELLR